MDAQPIAVRIIVVEDDQDYRLLLQQELEGCHLAEGLQFVSSDAELLDLLNRREANRLFSQDVVLIDVFPLKRDTQQVIARLKANSSLRPISLIGMLGSLIEEDILKDQNLNLDGYVVKPVTCQWLCAFLQGRVGADLPDVDREASRLLDEVTGL